MDKNQRLNEHFKKWKVRSKHLHFFEDGIINEQRFNEASSKILFLTKEPNHPSKKDEIEIKYDYRIWWSEEKGLYDRFNYRIVEWAYGILNNFPPYDGIWPKVKGKYDNTNAMSAITSIAFMNIKKSGGKSSSKETEINVYLEKHHDLILEQIEIIEPTIIIQGLTWESTIDKLYSKGEVKWKATGHGTYVGRFRYNNIDTKIIDFYHPSSQGSAVALYYLLEKVYNSGVFKEI